MKPIVAILAALILASCAGGLGRPGSRDSAAAGGSAPSAPCSYGGGATASGGMSCQGGTYYRCSNGAWQETALSCAR